MIFRYNELFYYFHLNKVSFYLLLTLFYFMNFATSFLLASKAIGAGLATIALAGVGTGIGIVFAGFLVAYSRNPSLKQDLFSNALLGFALVEAIALFGLMMAFLLLYS